MILSRKRKAGPEFSFLLSFMENYFSLAAAIPSMAVAESS
jgi:hypothetical protein